MTTQTKPAKIEPMSDAEFALVKEQNKYRRARRKARERAGEIKELNITAMMDMMTIILVFLIKSYTASSTNVTMTNDLTVPKSTTQQDPQDNISIVISLAEVAVNDKKAVPVENGIISQQFRESPGSLLVAPVYDMLKKEVDKQKYIAEYNPNAPFSGKVNIIADKRVPYQTLLAVVYTAGQAELGQYKLMALKLE